MAFTDAGKNSMLDHLGSEITYVGLLDASAVELTGGTPAYARKAITWAGSATGSMAMNGTDPIFDVPASSTVKYVIFMSALTNGTEYARATVTEESFANQGTYTLTDATLDLNAV